MSDGQYVVAGVHVRPLLQARQEGRAVATISLDLGLTAQEVALTPRHAVWPDGQALPWATVEEIARSGSACFVVAGGTARKITAYSAQLGRAYSLISTGGAPTIVNAGFTMHRIVGIDPHEDTLRKIRAVAPLRGRVLDTVTGLGYTAIEAARTADHVVTVELDPVVLEVARLNPWSRTLFDSPIIEQIVGDTFEVIQTFAEQSFARVIHDPPSLSLAGELYSGEYYRRVYRVLRNGGRLFHYVGNLESKHGGRITAGVIRRLKEAGFTRVVRRPEAFGLVAYKP